MGKLKDIWDSEDRWVEFVNDFRAKLGLPPVTETVEERVTRYNHRRELLDNLVFSGIITVSEAQQELGEHYP